MIDATLQSDLLTTISGLPEPKQLAVLHFAKALTVPSAPSTLPPGTPGSELLSMLGRWSTNDADVIQNAIELEFEQVDPRDW
jgi:hypothetical protein